MAVNAWTSCCAPLGRPLLALALLLASWPSIERARAEEAAARKPFSSDERARLSAGELVTRPVSEQRGDLRLIGGTSWQVIAAPPDVVYRAMRDTAHYHQLLPTVSRALLVSDHGALRRVVFEHKKGPMGIAYRVALTFKPEQRELTFKLNDPLDSGMRASWGFCVVSPYTGGKSLVTWGIMADPGEGLIVSLARGVIHEWMLKIPWQMRRFIESKEGQALYRFTLVGRGSSGNAGAAARKLDGGQLQQRLP